MKSLYLAPFVLLISANLCSAAYTYYQQYNPHYSGEGGESFTSNGTYTTVTVPPVNNVWGITSTGSTGASLISTMAVPDGSFNYEAAAALTLASSGGTYTIYLEASSNAVYGSPLTGSFYSISLVNPTVSGSTCSGMLSADQVVSGVDTNLALVGMPCRNGMTLHAAATTSGWIIVYGDPVVPGSNQVLLTFPYSTSTLSGKAGFGLASAPSGNYIADLQVGPIDRVAPDTPATFVDDAEPTYVDIHTAASTDDANGVGIMGYAFYRNSVIQTWLPGDDWKDGTSQPSTTYTYAVAAVDFHNNYSASLSRGVTTPPTSAVNPRQTGIRPTGSYWGGMGEQIDMRSGNLNYTLPLLSIQGRGWSVPLNLTYNSQNWLETADGSSWNYATDTGYGYGWNVQLGALRQFWTNSWAIDHWEFTDSSGATYRLDQNNGNVWSSLQSVYLWYDGNTGLLHFTNGTTWKFGCTSTGTELDAGDQHPTVIEDSNGNQVNITYENGTGVSWLNSSSRIANITDVRGSAYNFGYNSYNYTFDGVPYSGYLLHSLTNTVGTGESYTFQYAPNVQVASPFNPAYTDETSALLTSLTNTATSLSTSFAYDTTNTGELDQVTFPYAGTLGWSYGNEELADNRTTREVVGRNILWNSTIGQRQFSFARDSGDSGRYVPLYRSVIDSHANAKKSWYFNQTGAAQTLVSQYNQLNSSTGTTLRTTNYTWSQDSKGNNYISLLQAISDPGTSYTVTKQTQQTLDQYGNVTQSKLFSFTNLTTAAKTYNNTYLTGSSYAAAYIYNRLLTSTVTDSNNNTLTLATNTYDGATLQDAPGVTQFDSAYALSQNRIYRGNLTKSVSFANTTNATYDITGTAVTTTSNGHSASATNSATNNYAAPSQVTATNSLTTTFAWNQNLAPTNSTGPNGDTAAAVYDPNTSRPTSSTSPYGAVTTYTYANTAPQVTATVNGRWTQTYLDGLGRTYRVAAGYTVSGSNTTLSYTDTVYDTCGCTPIGKPYQTSMPFAPGATEVWKVNTYDAIGRTLTTVAPDGASTTSYVYQGNTVTVTDPAGKWKQYTTDAFGELTQVLEPSPNPATEPNHVTTYSFDVLGHLIQAQLPRTINGTVTTQTRTWTYSPTTQWLSSITQPETGTTSFTYNSDGTMATKIDAKSQETQYTYDSYADLIQVSLGTVSGGTFTEDLPQRVTYAYGAQGAPNNSAGRLKSITYNNYPVIAESYRYTAPGQVTQKSLSVSGVSLNASYTYDNEGRMLTVTYPMNPASGISPQYTYGFDTMGRLSTMAETDSGNFPIITATGYNAANQILSIAGLPESRTYNTNGQLTNLTSGSYRYAYNYSATQNNGRITSMQDVASGETIAYSYDSLNRLISASGTGDPQGAWSQTFSYDGFGNLLSKIGNNAPNVTSFSVNPATNQLTSNGALYDADGNMTAYGLSGQVTTFSHDEANRVSKVVPPGSPSNNSQAQYAYDTANQRIYASISTTVNNVNTTNNYVYLYGADGKKLGVWQLAYQGNNNYTLTVVSTNLWFGGRLLKGEDRLQSVGKYFPYGEDRYSPSPANPSNDQEKFATYTRDSISGLDYAFNRYYSAGMGRFMSADPYARSANNKNPPSWNKYMYAGNDPMNLADPSGLDAILFPCTVGAGEGVEVVGCEYYFSVTSFGPLDPSPSPLTRKQEMALLTQFRGDVMAGRESDCDALAEYVDEVAESLEGSRNGAQQLKSAIALLTPNQFPVFLIPGVSGNPDAQQLNPNQATSGFQPQYQDGENANYDQAHHFSAFFQLGFAYGADIAGNAATRWEQMEGTSGNVGDINLGQAASLMGAYVRAGTLPIDQVGQAIRNVLCK